jgi:hypothetical protein
LFNADLHGAGEQVSITVTNQRHIVAVGIIDTGNQVSPFQTFAQLDTLNLSQGWKILHLTSTTPPTTHPSKQALFTSNSSLVVFGGRDAKQDQIFSISKDIYQVIPS